MPSLFECVPNISEGRRPQVIAEIGQSLARVREATLLDISTDPDHNRTVYTLAGTRQGIADAVLDLCRSAVRLIDMRRHSGVHPRIGSVDVIPIIPLGATAMADCAELARESGAAVADDLGLPVYLYGNAAANPGRRILANLRKGGFESLADKMRETGRRPDYGACVPHPSAGVVAVGARTFLIAYNVHVTHTRRVADHADLLGVVREIARSVRESSGGLPGVQAMGVLLDSRGLGQVSMNLVDYERTGLRQVFERVRAEATVRGAEVVSSEVVGLVPRAALAHWTPESLLIENWRPEIVLETALEQNGVKI